MPGREDAAYRTRRFGNGDFVQEAGRRNRGDVGNWGRLLGQELTDQTVGIVRRTVERSSRIMMPMVVCVVTTGRRSVASGGARRLMPFTTAALMTDVIVEQPGGDGDKHVPGRHQHG